MKTKERKVSSDLADSENDKKHLQPDKATLELPEVKDIPGQEPVRPFLPGEMADTTISSADEEANELLDADEDEDIITDETTKVTTAERDLLQRSSESISTDEDEQINAATLDNVDDEGTGLNERIDRSGRDLDVPGSDEDDANEEIGEEDEENNSYSIRDPENE